MIVSCAKENLSFNKQCKLQNGNTAAAAMLTMQWRLNNGMQLFNFLPDKISIGKSKDTKIFIHKYFRDRCCVMMLLRSQLESFQSKEKVKN